MKYAIFLALWNKDRQREVSFADDLKTAYEVAYEFVEIIAPSGIGEVIIVDTETNNVVEKMNVE